MHRKLQASSEVDIPTWNFFRCGASQVRNVVTVEDAGRLLRQSPASSMDWFPLLCLPWRSLLGGSCSAAGAVAACIKRPGCGGRFSTHHESKHNARLQRCNPVPYAAPQHSEHGLEICFPAVPRRAFFRLLGDRRRAFSKLPLDHELPTSGTCHMSSWGSFRRSSTRSRLRTLNLRKQQLRSAVGLGQLLVPPGESQGCVSLRPPALVHSISPELIWICRRLLVRLGHAATCSDSQLDFRQAQSAAEVGCDQSALLEPDVADKYQGCPRSL